jgi:hypothetical protein
MALETPDRSTPLATVGGIVGAVIGAVVANYSWAQMLVPLAVTIPLLVLFAKTPLKPPRFGGAIAVTIGHVAWFAVGAALTGAWTSVALDIALLTAAVAFLWARPSIASAVVLGAIELASLVFNVVLILDAALFSAGHRALTVHILLRVIVLAALAMSVLSLRTKQEPAATPDA